MSIFRKKPQDTVPDNTKAMPNKNPVGISPALLSRKYEEEQIKKYGLKKDRHITIETIF